MRPIFTLLFFLVFAVVASSQQNSILHQKFDAAMDKGQFNKAKRILEKITKKDSQSYLTLLKRAEYFTKKEELDSAKYYIIAAIHFNFANQVSYQENNFKKEKDEFYTASILVLDKLINRNPTSQNYDTRGILKKDLGFFRESLVDFTMSIKADPSNKYAYYNRGLAYRRLNLPDSAILDYQECIRLDPQYLVAYLNRGFAYLYKNEYRQAIDDFQLVIDKTDINQTKSFALNNMGFAHYKLGEFEQGYLHIQESLKLNPVNSFAYKNLALIDIALGDIPSACLHIEESIRLGFVDQYGDEILLLKEQHCK